MCNDVLMGLEGVLHMELGIEVTIRVATLDDYRDAAKFGHAIKRYALANTEMATLKEVHQNGHSSIRSRHSYT